MFKVGWDLGVFLGLPVVFLGCFFVLGLPKLGKRKIFKPRRSEEHEEERGEILIK